MNRDEYFQQDILVRLDQARAALETAESDPSVYQDDGIGLTVNDLINDAYVEIKRLRNELVDMRNAGPGKRARLLRL